MIGGVGGGGSSSALTMAQMQQTDQLYAEQIARQMAAQRQRAMGMIGGGMIGALPMMFMFGPMGALFGAAIGMFGAASGMQGNPMMGMFGGAAMGGLAGMAMGNPMIGMLFGGATGGILALLFNNMGQQQVQQPQYAPYYPQPNFGGGSYAYAYAGQNGAHAVAGSYYPPYPPPRPPINWGGHLSQEGEGKPINYTTSGGYKVTINGGQITIVDPSGKHNVTHSGDPHEYVNGKHIKDWDEKTRTLILSDGTKITMNATGPHGVIENYSIYDGAQSIQINAKGNKIDQHSFDPRVRMWQDAYQADGETAYIGYDHKGNFIYRDIYKQNPDLGVTPMYRDLARVERNWWNPFKTTYHVHDLYDDPRLGNT